MSSSSSQRRSTRSTSGVRVHARAQTDQFPRDGHDDHDHRVAPDAGRRTMPWSWYSDPAILAREHRADLPLLAGSTPAISVSSQGPGSYFASATGPVPIVMTSGSRRDAARLRQRLPASRRDRATGAERRGHAAMPYHAWTYGLDGCLRAAPRSGEDPGVRARRDGTRAGCGRHVGTVRVRQSGSARQPLAEALAELPRSSPSTGSTSAALRFNRRVSYEIRANWKIAMENYLECYHCPVNHPGPRRGDRRAPAGAARRAGCGPVSSRRSIPRSLDGRGPIDAHGGP